MSRPDVLVYIDWFSPGFKAGGPVRSMLNLAQRLGPLVRFNIITRDRDYLSDKPYPSIASDSWLDFEGGHRIVYLSPQRCTYRGLKQASRQVNYTKIYINGFLSPRFSILPLLVHRNERPIITVAPRGMLRSSATAFKSKKKSIFFFCSKLFGLHRGVRFHATDEREMEDIRARFPRSRVHFSPNLPRPLPPFRTSEKRPGRLRIAFVGRVAPEKNLHFALKVLSELGQGQVIFNSFGAVYDPAYGRLCEDLSKGLPSNVLHVHHVSIDPEQVIQTLQDHDLLFLPSQGENFGHVILESLSASRPVLISDQTPWKDLMARRAGAEFPLSKPEEFKGFLNRVMDMELEDHEEFSRGAFNVAKAFSEDEQVMAKAKALFLD